MGGFDREGRLRPAKTSAVNKPNKTIFLAFYGALLLLPIAGIVDGFGLNIELSAQSLYQRLRPFYLEVSRANGFAISYNTNADSLTGAIPGSAGYYRPLSLPLFCWLYLAIAATEAIAYAEVAVDILRTCQAVQRGQLLYVAGFGAAIVNFDTVPAAGELSRSRFDSFFDGVKIAKARKRKRTSGGRMVTQSH